MCHAGTVDDVTWGALTLTLTAIGGFYTWWAYKTRGMTPAIRGLAITLLPAAAWLTGTLRLFTEIADAVTDWAVHLVFSPKVWLGVILAVLSVVLFVISGKLRDRGVGGGSPRRTSSDTQKNPAPRALPKAKQPPGAARRRRHRRRDRRDPQAARYLLTGTNAERVLELVDERPPTLGRGRLLCVDGPAGSGKTTLADEIRAITGAPVVHMDNLYEGWDGLPRVGQQLERLLLPAVAEPARAATGAGTGTPTAGPRSWWSRPRPSWCSRVSAPGPGRRRR